MAVWSQAPPERPAPSRPPALAAWALGTVPVLVQLFEVTERGGIDRWLRDWALPVAIVTAAVLLIARARAVLAPFAAVAGVAAIALALPEGGLRVGLVAVTGLGLWALALGVVGVAPERLAGGRALWPALVLVVPADVLLVVGPGLRAPAVLLAAAVLVAGLAALGAPASLRVVDAVAGRAAPLAPAAEAVGRIVGTVARAVGRALLVVAMVPALIVTCVVWLVHRLVGHDPLRGPAAAGTRWVRRVGDDPHPQRFHGSAPVRDERPLGARLSGVAVVVVLVLVGAAAVVAVRDRSGDEPLAAALPDGTPSATSAPPSGDGETATPTTEGVGAAPEDCPEPPDDPVLGDQPQYEVLYCEHGAAFGRGEYQAPAGYRMADFAGETINEVDGVRRTWAPPECDCRRYTVWWFGGSAAWGEGQRDLFSLPSMVARAAWEDGVALDIVNRGMPTYTFGQEAHLFADVLSAEEPPDLVVFYTGANDLVFQGLRDLRGAGDDASDILLVDQQLDDLMRAGIPVVPQDALWSPTPEGLEGTLTAEAGRRLAEPAMERVDRNLGLVELLAEAVDVPVVVLFQPMLAGSGPDAGPPGIVPDELMEGFTAMVERARELMPEGVVDVTDTYADVDEPVFFDLFHTGEAGAAQMADRAYAELAPSLPAP